MLKLCRCRLDLVFLALLLIDCGHRCQRLGNFFGRELFLAFHFQNLLHVRLREIQRLFLPRDVLIFSQLDVRAGDCGLQVAPLGEN